MAEMSMVEKVARAMFHAECETFKAKTGYGKLWGWDDVMPAVRARHLAAARAAIEAISFPEITEDSFYEIEEAAAKKMREWERGYVCQDIRIQHSMVWWVAKEVEARMRTALSEHAEISTAGSATNSSGTSLSEEVER